MKKIPFVFSDNQISGGFQAEIPPQICFKEKLLEVLGDSLKFPDFYGYNWDAFEECIRDLSWLSEFDIVVRHGDVPLVDDPINARVYLMILIDAVQMWNARSLHHLKVQFPLQCEPIVERLI